MERFLPKSQWWHRYAPAFDPNPVNRELKRLIWIYWILWLTEGAIRKWVLPQYAGPLVLIRDPIAAWILIRAFTTGRLKLGLGILFLYGITLGSFILTMARGVPLPVGLIGIRTVALHFPLAFVIANVLTREDIARIGNLVLDTAFPMAVLMVMQFKAGAGAFINAGAGLNAEQIGGEGAGTIRAPAIFSFITGAVQFFSLVTAFWLAKFSRQEKLHWSFLLAGVSVPIAVGVAISRAMVLTCALIFCVFLLLSISGRITARRIMLLIFSIGVISAVTMTSEVLDQGMGALTSRWYSAEGSEGSVFVRAVNNYLVKSDTMREAGVFGQGLGLGTNMGAALMGREGEFLLAEVEYERIVLEMGVVFGLAFIFWRLWLFAITGSRVIRVLRQGDTLPALLFAAIGPNILNGQTAQTTTLGYIAMGTGFVLAAAKMPGKPMGSRLPPYMRRLPPRRFRNRAG